MKSKKMILGVAMLACLYGVSTVDAARGNLTCVHGEENGEAMAEIISTHTEASMRIDMQLVFDDGSTGYPKGEARDVSRYKLKSGFNFWKHGRSTADYYVNGVHVHTTTEAYAF
ncbi:hypothetical protein KG091_02265 [Carnobacteriaceae bacterium zg-ZUI78]|nr:hypothetical protein [Carnobacteriaceae bacterium zg-ZUI78]